MHRESAMFVLALGTQPKQVYCWHPQRMILSADKRSDKHLTCSLQYWFLPVHHQAIVCSQPMQMVDQAQRLNVLACQTFLSVLTCFLNLSKCHSQLEETPPKAEKEIQEKEIQVIGCHDDECYVQLAGFLHFSGHGLSEDISPCPGISPLLLSALWRGFLTIFNKEGASGYFKGNFVEVALDDVIPWHETLQ